MSGRASLIPIPAIRQLTRPETWKLTLLAGFVAQLLLILFVTAIGLKQLGMTTRNLDTVVDVHMRKQNLTKTMVVAARQRTLIMFMLTRTGDPFARDDLLMQFHRQGSEFVTARLALLDMPLNARERQLIAQQQQLIARAQPIQEQVLDLISANYSQDAIDLVLRKAIPAQNDVMAVLSQLDAETQRVALDASRRAHEAHQVARNWMYLLSGIALLLGLLVAVFVLRYTSRISHERERLATHDTLTGLPNRMLFMDRLEQALMRARRRRTRVGVIFVDLDRFKRVNDTLGHASGDLLISEVARRLRAAARAEDTVARLGGDEFVVVIGDAVELNHILQVVEKMLAVVTEPYRIAGREIFCSCSIGVSVYPNDGLNSVNLLKHADTAMYHAKAHGRNCFQLYNPAMNAMAEERLQLETDLHYALERNEFVLHYQPQLNLENGRIQAFEALLRWQHPEKGMLKPAVFLDMLEESGGIVNIGRALLLEACRQTAAWRAAGLGDLGIAVNVSGKEFWHEDLIQGVHTALTHSGLPPHALQIELTEGIFMEDLDAAISRIHALKALGVTVAIDDFGTGYSSLAHLKRFPLDVLKIDRYFVKDLEQSPLNGALVGSILTLSKGLRLDAIAEGVEDAHQLEQLRRLGCWIVQGHLVSPPVAAEAVPGLMQHDWLRAFDDLAQITPLHDRQRMN
jgi:diguanylate cyclase (GGDEF)-like protein